MYFLVQYRILHSIFRNTILLTSSGIVDSKNVVLRISNSFCVIGEYAKSTYLSVCWENAPFLLMVLSIMNNYILVHTWTYMYTVEGLYCKMPIQCLASSEILTSPPPTPHRQASVYPPVFGAGGGHTRWVERGWGVNSSEDARYCSVLYTVYISTLWCIHSFPSTQRTHTQGFP